MFTQHVETSPVIGQSPRSAAEARADHSSAIELLEAELLYDALVAGVDGNAQLAAMTGSSPSGAAGGAEPEGGEYSAESSSIAMQLLDEAMSWMFEEHPTLPPPPPGVPHGATLDGEDRRR